MQDGDGDAGDDARNNMCFAEGAGAAGDEGEEKTLEEAGGFVEGLFERVVDVHVQFFSFVDLFADAVEEDGGDEVLGDVGFGGDEDAGGGVYGVGGPFVGLGDVEECVPVWECR